jgi:hypothetical protein
MDKIHATVNCLTLVQKNSQFYSTESDTGSTMEDVDGVERESVSREIKLRKVKGQGRRTPRKNWCKHQGIIVICV